MSRNTSDAAGTIFITGASGVIGHRVAQRLLDAGYHNVRLGAIDPVKLEDMNEKGAAIADFAWEREETYDQALAGAKTVLCVTPYIENWHIHFPAFLIACEKAKIEHFVKLSFIHCNDELMKVPLVKNHFQCDKHLMESVVWCKIMNRYTIIAASHLMSNALVCQGKEIMSENKPACFYGASAGHGVNYVSPNDVAEMTYRVLMDPEAHANKEYTVTGREAMTDQSMADILSKHFNKPVMFVDQPPRVFEDSERCSGDPAWKVKDLVMLEKVKASGIEEDASFVSHDMEKLCGRKPEMFEQYLGAKNFMTPKEMGMWAA